MTEKIVKEDDFREGISRGINDLANAVKDTLGPMGNTVAIKNVFGEIIVTKDGVSVAEEIVFDPNTIESIGAELVKNVALKANNLAGDGTTTATVFAQALYNAGKRQLALGVAPAEFIRGIKIAMVDVLKYVNERSKDVELNTEELKSVALISSNGDEVLAETITNIYNELGVNGVISITEGSGMQTTQNIIQGMQFDRGYISPYSVTDKTRMKTEFDTPLILLFDGVVSQFKQVFAAVEAAGQKNRPLIIVAEDVKDSALRGLVVNHIQGNVVSAIVQSPGYGNKRVERLHDMAALFGAKVVSKDTQPEDFDPSWLGEMERAEITAKDTAFIGGFGTEEAIAEREAFIKSQLEHFKGNKYEVDILNERLGKLTSGVAVLKIGAMSKEEGKELFDRAEDCKYAVKAALQEGIINGGGTELLAASNHLRGKKFKPAISEDLIAGYNTLLNVVKAPFRQIIVNAGLIPEVIELGIESRPEGTGYDVKNREFVDSMMEAGIIDPYKVVRIALESSVSIVCTLLSSNYAIINKDDVTVANYTN
jgi:chaperonin GroEL